jgi:hypothetical protein
MPWAEFRNGRIVALPEAVEPLPDVPSTSP